MKNPSMRGFTLLELIISLTIFSMVAVIIYGALNVGVRAAERGEVRSTENQRARAALTLIARHLKSAYPLSLPGEEGNFVYFFGDRYGVSFVSAAGRPEAGGLEKVSYFLRESNGRRSLWVRTSSPTLPADLLNRREGPLVQEAEVLPNVESISWEYLSSVQSREQGKLQDREEWTDHWDGLKERQLPSAIRFAWRARLGELPEEWRVEVPLYVTLPPPDLLGAAQGGAAGARRGRFRGQGGDQ